MKAKELLGYLYELQALIKWKEGLDKGYETLTADIAIIEGPKPKRLNNKGKCHLGLLLEHYRIKQGWRVKDILTALDCADTSYRAWIRGDHQPSNKARTKMSKLLGAQL